MDVFDNFFMYDGSVHPIFNVEDIRKALGHLTRFQEHVEVILGLNLKESVEVGRVLGLAAEADPEATIATAASAIRHALGIGCVVIHPRRSAAAATH